MSRAGAGADPDAATTAAAVNVTATLQSEPESLQRQPSLAVPTQASLPTEPPHERQPSLQSSKAESELQPSKAESELQEPDTKQLRSSGMHQQLPFFQRYFTKSVPAAGDDEKQDHDERRFSFLSLGSLVVQLLVLLVLAGVIAAAVATTRAHHRASTRLAIPSNFPDPALLYDNGSWYAFATNNAAGVLPYFDGHRSSQAEQNTPDWGRANIQMAISKDFVNWATVPLSEQPLPDTGEWTQKHVNGTWIQPKISGTWAPAVIRTDGGKYVMYYASVRSSHNPYTKVNGFDVSHPAPHCIGAAVSNGDSPAGPYTPINEEWICPWEQGGAIDPEVIRDSDGTLYLVYKVDGNNIGSGGECGNTKPPMRPTPIMLQKLSPNGTSLVGQPSEILANSPSDGPLVEAPMLVRSQEGIYFLFYSSGCTRGPSYDTKYATATTIAGPYTRQNAVFLQTGLWDLEAPGSIGIVDDGEGGWNMAFHARVDDGDVGRVRAMFSAKLALRGHDALIV